MNPLLLPLALALTPVVDLPRSGKPVSELVAFDDAMVAFMEANGIEAGVLGVMRGGTIIYQRGFGYLHPPGSLFGPQPLPENALMRLASVEKPLTAAAVHKLVGTGAIQLTDQVFELGQPGGGILTLTPWGGLQDQRLKDVTVQDLLDHEGGWDRDLISYDPMFQAIEIADAMGASSPASRVQVAQFMLGQPLQWEPGTVNAYSNFGYMLLGLIVEVESGRPHQEYIKDVLFAPEWWMPRSELIHGRSFRADQSPREPWYRASGEVPNVFDPSGDDVNFPYGGWHHEAMIGHGNIVGGAVPLLRFLDEYNVFGSSIGLPKGSGNPSMAHTGGLPGTDTIARQASNGMHVVVLFNKVNDPAFSNLMASQIYALASSVPTWPTEAVDGFWVEPGLESSGFGGFHDPFSGLGAALAGVGDSAKLRLKPGNDPFTGVINQRVLLDAPVGGVLVLGQ